MYMNKKAKDEWVSIASSKENSNDSSLEHAVGRTVLSIIRIKKF